MKQFEAHIRSNRCIAHDYYEMVFSWPDTVEEPLPGQFVSIKSFGTTDLILRRPFAVSGFERATATASIIFERRGKATTMLTRKARGDTVDIIGPLGNCFPVDHGTSAVLVGGGVGLGPILFLGNWFADRARPATVVLGFRDAAHVPFLLTQDKIASVDAVSVGSRDLTPEQDIRSLGTVRFKPVLCTDDGSSGFCGTVVDWLREAAAGRPERFSGSVVHACGPNPMMAACSSFCEQQGLPCWVSMEQIMGCGVGACIGCAIPVAGDARFARVCTEGPVFDSRQILWEQME